jgi:hypothetical protein
MDNELSNSGKEFAIENLNAILAVDKSIYDRLYEFGSGNVNALISQRVIDKLREPRYLDKPPNSLKLQKSGGIQSGCKEIFKYAYRSASVGDNDQSGVILFGEIEMKCEIEIVKLVRALLQVGTCRNDDLSDSCKRLVFEIVKLGTGGMPITKALIKERLHADGYYQEQLVEAIHEAFGDGE